MAEPISEFWEEFKSLVGKDRLSDAISFAREKIKSDDKEYQFMLTNLEGRLNEFEKRVLRGGVSSNEQSRSRANIRADILKCVSDEVERKKKQKQPNERQLEKGTASDSSTKSTLKLISPDFKSILFFLFGIVLSLIFAPVLNNLFCSSIKIDRRIIFKISIITQNNDTKPIPANPAIIIADTPNDGQIVSQTDENGVAVLTISTNQHNRFGRDFCHSCNDKGLFPIKFKSDGLIQEKIFTITNWSSPQIDTIYWPIEQPNH